MIIYVFPPIASCQACEIIDNLVILGAHSNFWAFPQSRDTTIGLYLTELIFGVAELHTPYAEINLTTAQLRCAENNR